MNATAQKPRRAQKGSLDPSCTLLLRLSSGLRRQVDRAAEHEGLSASEWIRQAVEALLPARAP